MKRPAAAAPAELPEGWSIQTKQRKTGATKGVVDKYYVSPSGKKFDSFKKVLEEIEGK